MCFKNSVRRFSVITWPVSTIFWISNSDCIVTHMNCIFLKIKTSNLDRTTVHCLNTVFDFDLFFCLCDNDYCIRHVCLQGHYLTWHLWPSTARLCTSYKDDCLTAATACVGVGRALKNSTEGLLRLKGGLCISIIHLVPCILFSTPKTCTDIKGKMKEDMEKNKAL